MNRVIKHILLLAAIFLLTLNGPTTMVRHRGGADTSGASRAVTIADHTEETITPGRKPSSVTTELPAARPGTITTPGKYGLRLHAQLPTLKIETQAAFKRSEKRSVQLSLLATDNGSGLANIELLHDGAPLAPVRTLREHDEDGRRVTRIVYQAKLVKGTNVFTATAENGSRLAASADPVEIYYGAGTSAPTLYVLAIGINQYMNRLLTLNYARNDAEAVVRQIEASGDVLFKRTEITALFDSDATSASVNAGLDNIAKHAQPEDVFLLYYAGHGSAVAGQYYFVTTENPRLYDRDSLKKHAISAVQLQKKLHAIRTRKQLVMIDACQSGAAARPLIAGRGLSGSPDLKDLSAAASVYVITSSGKQEYSNEMEKLSHGSFTYALLEGLKGEADAAPKDNRITAAELQTYLQAHVPTLARRYSSDSQFPTVASVGSDFPIAVVKEDE